MGKEEGEAEEVKAVGPGHFQSTAAAETPARGLVIKYREK